MKAVTANEAKTQFGDMLMSVQRAPVQINKNGKPVAVMVSMDDYEQMEDLKIQMLKERVQRAKTEIEAGATIEGDAFFDELLAKITNSMGAYRLTTDAGRDLSAIREFTRSRWGNEQSRNTLLNYAKPSPCYLIIR